MAGFGQCKLYMILACAHALSMQLWLTGLQLVEKGGSWGVCMPCMCVCCNNIINQNELLPYTSADHSAVCVGTTCCHAGGLQVRALVV
jgi:hypothetical protein